MFANKTLLIVGGTGSFGTAVLDRFLTTDIAEIRVFSRDEKKQDEQRHKYRSAKVKYYLGDVRELSSVKNAMRGVDYVFQAAALKQVPSCEFFPLEAVKTNILGTDNVLTACIEEGVRKVICLSTDKAAYPINAMGMSKALMEKVFVAKSRAVDPARTLICGTRYGNVLCSRGSVVPLFIDQIERGVPLTVTDPTMTRFIMSLTEAVELVLFAFERAEAGDILIQKAPACTIGDLARATQELFGVSGDLNVIGIRHGEKMYETLLTREESAHAHDLGRFFRIPADNRDLNYDKYVSAGSREPSRCDEFNSQNARRLGVEEVKDILLRQPYVQEALRRFEARR